MAKIVTDTGARTIKPTVEVLDNDSNEVVGGYGLVEPVTGLEERPCYTCTSFDFVDEGRIIRHLLSKKMRMREDGKFESPIQDDFKNEKRANLVMNPKDFGWCRSDGIIVQGQATCDKWNPAKTVSEFAQRFIRRK